LLIPSPNLSQRERDKFALSPKGKGLSSKRKQPLSLEGEAGVRGNG
jgi:hypothetical protein